MGGGLIRSLGGWSVVKAMGLAEAYQKGDERILYEPDRFGAAAAVDAIGREPSNTEGPPAGA